MPDATPAPVLLVHGAWHGAWCWSAVLHGLIEAGHPALAIDTPGHGITAPIPDAFRRRDAAGLATEVSALASMGVADHAAPVVEAVRRLHEAHGPVVLVGHSLGGVTLHHVAEAAPEALRGVVYVAAFAPSNGRSVLDDAARPGFAASLFSRLPVADPGAIGAMRIDWASEDPEYRRTAQRCFYGDVPEPLRTAATRLLTPDEPAALYTEAMRLTAERFGSVPRAFVRCTADRAVPVEAQDEAIAALDAERPERRFAVRTLEASHSPFLSQPGRLTEVLLELSRGG